MAKKNSWRPQPATGAPAAFKLMVRRLISTLFFLGLAALFLYLIIAPWLKPVTSFVYMTSVQETIDDGVPLQYAFEDFRSFTPLEESLASRSRDKPALMLAPVGTIDDLSQSNLWRRDRLILYITAHGEVIDGIPYLRCQTKSGDERRLSVRDMLASVANVPCATKLILLDASREGWSPERTPGTTDFTQLVMNVLTELDDESLWIITASQGLERSHVVPALKQSVFGYVVSKGLRGAADWNHDKRIRVDELYHFVEENVRAWVDQQTDNHATQNPRLLHCNLERSQRNSPRLIKLKTVEADPNVLADAQAAEATDDATILENVGSFVLSISAQFAIPSPSQIGARLKRMGRITGLVDEETYIPEEASSADETPPEFEANPGKLVTERLQENWKLVDQLTPQLQVRQSARGIPVRNDPQQWQDLTSELVWLEHSHHAGSMISQRKLLTRVAQLNSELSFLAGEEASTPADGSRASLLAKSHSADPFAAQDISSFGMVESILANRMHASKTAADLRSSIRTAVSQEIPALPTLISSFDQTLRFEDVTRLDAWLEQNGENWATMREVAYAQKFRALGVDWILLRELLRVYRQSEVCISDSGIADGWGRHQIESADRARWEVERLVESRSRTGWRQAALRGLSVAKDNYQKAKDVLDDVHTATHLRNRTLSRCRPYLELLSVHDSAATSPQITEFSELCSRLRELDDVLQRGVLDTDQDDKEPRRKLNAAQRSLQAVVDRIENRLANSETLQSNMGGNAWRIETRLNSPLLSQPTRETLRQQLARVSKEMVGNFQFIQSRPEIVVDDVTLSESDWKTVVRQLDLESTIASLVRSVPDLNIVALKTSDPINRLANVEASLLEKLHGAGLMTVLDVASAQTDTIAEHVDGGAEDKRIVANTVRDLARKHECNSFQRRLTQFYDRLSIRINEVAEYGALQGRRGELLAARHDLYLLPPDRIVDTVQPSTSKTEWHGYLVWRANRALQSCEDAYPEERRLALVEHARYLQLVDKLQSFPPLADAPDVSVKLNLGSDLSLVTREQDQLTVLVESNDVAAASVWLVLEYDNTLLRVLPKQGLDVYDIHNPPASRALAKTSLRHPTHISEYPARIDLLAPNKPTIRLQPGGKAAIPLTVQHLPGAHGSTALVVKAISGRSYVRDSVQVNLPGNRIFDLALVDPLTRKSLDSNGAILAYANRQQEVLFQLKGPPATEFEAAIYSPRRRPTHRSMPTGPVDSDLFDELLTSRFGTLARIGKTAKTKMPSSGIKHLTFQFDDDDPTKTQNLENGLLLVITDHSRAGRKSIKQIEVGVRPPQTYLEATAEYTQFNKRLTVRLKASEAEAIPTGGAIPVHLSFEEELDFRGKSPPLLDERIEKFEETVELYATVDIPKVTAHVEVDGYPRGFIFEVDCTANNPGQLAKFKRVRIVSPNFGAIIPLKKLRETNRIPIRVEVDAETFARGSDDSVQLGIDRDLDGEIDDERGVVTLNSDRQVKIFADGSGDQGHLSLRTKVSDIEVDLSAIGLLGEAQIIGLLTTGNTSVYSDRPDVLVKVDGQGPRILGVDVGEDADNADQYGREISIGSQKEITVTVDDDFSKIAQVQLGFDTLNKGDFTGVEKPFDAKRVSTTNNQWRINEKIPDLPIGAQKLWIRAVDEAGNKTDHFEEVTVIPKAQVPAAKPKGNKPQAKGGKKTRIVPQSTSVAGKLDGGTRKIRDGFVYLMQGEKRVKRIAPDANGRFRFRDVPAGSYEVSARVQVGGNWLKGGVPVKVNPKTGPVVIRKSIPVR